MFYVTDCVCRLINAFVIAGFVVFILMTNTVILRNNRMLSREVVDTSVGSVQVCRNIILLTNKSTSTSSVTASLDIIAKNELIELTLFRYFKFFQFFKAVVA